MDVYDPASGEVFSLKMPRGRPKRVKLELSSYRHGVFTRVDVVKRDGSVETFSARSSDRKAWRRAMNSAFKAAMREAGGFAPGRAVQCETILDGRSFAVECDLFPVKGYL